MRRFHYGLRLLILTILGVSTIFYFDFTAEDAYITYRYAENWVNTGSLVYNEGEPINAMTSPLHALLSAALFSVTGHTVLSNKILSLVFLIISALLAWYQNGKHYHLQTLGLILLVPPSVLLWTFGGLETPILLFLATVTVISALSQPPFRLSLLYLIFLLAGLAFLTRYDSILFFLPATIYVASSARSPRHIVLALTGAAVLPLAWFLISISYYGDFLPTSFYVKSPTSSLGGVIFNGVYIASYLIYLGIIPVLALVLLLLARTQGWMGVLWQHIAGIWWLYTGLLLELLYGLTMATHHMMFSFRIFVPYIPAAVILILDLLRHASESREVDLITGRSSYLFAGFLLCLTLFHVYQNVYTYNHSVNGISRIGEYRALGVRDYVSYMQILKQEGLDIEKHWEVINKDSGRRPRVITFAAGILPYTYRESYIYEKLVSYRHCHERYRQGLYADYIHILAPRLGRVDQQLPRSEETYDLVSSYEMTFDGSLEEFLVYYNPKPKEHNLSVRIYEPCQQGEDVVN